MIVSRLQGRVKNVRDVAQFAGQTVDVGSVEQVDCNIAGRCLEFGASPRKADDLPIAQRNEMLDERGR